MKEQFVPYEIAIRLKEKGFNDPCMASFNIWDTFIRDIYEPAGTLYTNTSFKVIKNEEFVAAPLWQQVIDWLSDVHNIEVDAMRYTYRGGVYQGKCYMWFVDQYDPKYNHELEEDDSHWILNERKAQGYDFKTKREAILAGITEALTLI
jgi:hypothetical protein